MSLKLSLLAIFFFLFCIFDLIRVAGFVCVQDLEERNIKLEQQVQKAEQTLAISLDAQLQAESEVRKVIEVLDVKIFDLNNLRQSLAKLVDN